MKSDRSGNNALVFGRRQKMFVRLLGSMLVMLKSGLPRRVDP
jgi:hypothetical protein